MYPQSSLTNSETSFPARSDERRLYSQASREPQEITGNECARIVYRISVSSDLATNDLRTHVKFSRVNEKEAVYE